MAVFNINIDPIQIEADVRARLANSLSHISIRARDRLDFDRGELDAALHKIGIERQNPGIFARYFDLVLAYEAGDYLAANALLGEIIERTRQPTAFSIVSFDRETLGSDFERFPRLLFSESDGANPMASPPKKVFLNYREQLETAVEIVKTVDPAIGNEITDLLAMICVAQSNSNKEAGTLGSCTSLMVWGATFVNLDNYRSQWETVLFLVHEITHSLLLGLSCDEPLVRNPLSKNFRSPLRTEPRPMDGIYHAVMVCARVTAFCRVWLDSGLLEGTEADEIQKTTKSVYNKFKAGAEVINKRGELSDHGRRLLDESRKALSVTV